jgi:hypothetical protein
MMRALLLLLPAVLAGCISLSSTKSTAAPDYRAFCNEKEMQCKETCAEAGVLSFSCKAGPQEGMQYQCECKKPGQRL